MGGLYTRFEIYEIFWGDIIYNGRKLSWDGWVPTNKLPVTTESTEVFIPDFRKEFKQWP